MASDLDDPLDAPVADPVGAPVADPVDAPLADPVGALVDDPVDVEVDQPVDRLSPAQREVLTALGARPGDRPEFDPRLRTQLRDELEERLAPLVAHLGPRDDLWIGKRQLASVHGCEGLYLAQEAEEFEWSPPVARGVVAHKAIELSIHWRGEPAPGDLVDEAIARLVQGGDRVATYLGGVGEGERAEVRGGAVERTTMFLECFPPLESRWRPVTESRVRADLCEDRITLSGKVDLTVGRSSGMRAGKVLLDLKTGGFSPTHRDDLRFYALLETIKVGVPPRLLASYYLDGGRIREEAVTEPLLRAALERTVRGAEAIIELRDGRPPEFKPGTPCRWCPARDTCGPGRAWQQAQDAEDGLDPGDGW